MIRINLLPIKQDRRREAGLRQLFIAIAVILVICGIFWGVHMHISEKVDAQTNKNAMLKAEVDKIKKRIQDHQAILGEIKEFEKRQAAIEGLQDARTGPVFVMLELSNILSKSGRPQIDNDRYQEMIQIDPAAGYDENWDHRRLWLDGFKEKERRVEIVGQALTHEDVAEFLRRINLSNFFVSNELVSTDLKAPSVGKIKIKSESKPEPVVHFKVSGQIRYR
ncbi:MAG: PilN domain-containing protein [Deltaproteobacteria bacterium]|nr:PilN domain-containing protein [Deltaproteobacteria bacterium]